LLTSDSSFSIDAPCKINLNLNVGEQREDGFHSIESVFTACSLADTLEFASAGTRRDEIYMETAELPPFFAGMLDDSSLPPEKNLVYRAIERFKQESGFAKYVKVHIFKKIPPAAGLGGGSSDAAAALLAMNRLSGMALDTGTLLNIAAGLGSDIPFFVSIAAGISQSPPPYSAAFVSGRGERVEPLAVPLLNVVIVNPGIKSNTKEAFALLDTVRLQIFGGTTFQKKISKTDILAAITKNPAEWPYYNDFLPVFLNSEPQNKVYHTVLHDLKQNEAVFCGLSGSGSSCFGIFSTAAAAESAAARLSTAWPFVRAVHTLSADNRFAQTNISGAISCGIDAAAAYNAS
jgi:4-diphosphocytidyl-2-C-methyl-D-erythritol kinase